MDKKEAIKYLNTQDADVYTTPKCKILAGMLCCSASIMLFFTIKGIVTITDLSRKISACVMGFSMFSVAIATFIVLCLSIKNEMLVLFPEEEMIAYRTIFGKEYLCRYSDIISSTYTNGGSVKYIVKGGKPIIVGGLSYCSKRYYEWRKQLEAKLAQEREEELMQRLIQQMNDK